jgi:hypothetical protein
MPDVGFGRVSGFEMKKLGGLANPPAFFVAESWGCRKVARMERSGMREVGGPRPPDCASLHPGYVS